MRIAVIQSRIPAPGRSGAELRILQVIDTLLAQGHELTVVSTWPEESAEALAQFRSRPLRVFHEDAEALRLLGVDRIPAWSFRTLLAGGRFDRVILPLWFWQQFTSPELYAGTIRRLSPPTGMVLLSDDSHGVRERMLAGLATAPVARATDWEYAEAVAERERESYAAADAILAVTEGDRRAIQALAPGEVPVVLAPLHVPITKEPPPPFAGRRGLLFLGNFTNPAVCDAARFLVGQVMPEVWRLLLDTVLDLAGYGSDSFQAELPPGVRVLGPVEQLQPVFDRYLVFVSPLRAGTGICTKNLTAMAAGLPLVTTALGAQGLPEQAPTSFLEAETPAGFAQQIASLCRNQGVWDALAQGARAAVASSASPAALSASLEEALLAAQSRHIAPVFSARAVEQRLPGLRTSVPSNERKGNRLRATVLLAEELIEQGWVTDGIVQLRHALTAVRFGADPGRELGRHFNTLAHGYRLLGDTAGVARSRAAAEALRAELLGADPPLPASSSAQFP